MLLATNRLVSSLLPDQFQRLRQELNNSLVDFHNGLRATQGVLSTNLWLNVGEDKNELLVQVELPGLTPEQISMVIHENTVQLIADIPFEEQEPKGKWLQRERVQTKTQREFQVPFLIDAQRSTAVYQKGILELRLKKSALSEPQTLALSEPESASQ